MQYRFAINFGTLSRYHDQGGTCTFLPFFKMALLIVCFSSCTFCNRVQIMVASLDGKYEALARVCSQTEFWRRKYLTWKKWYSCKKMPWSDQIAVCQRSSDSFHIVKLLYKIGHYFLDIQYLFNFTRAQRLMRTFWLNNSDANLNIYRREGTIGPNTKECPDR